MKTARERLKAESDRRRVAAEKAKADVLASESLATAEKAAKQHSIIEKVASSFSSNPVEAIRLLQTAPYPDSPLIHYWLAYCYYKQEDYSNAVPHFEKALPVAHLYDPHRRKLFYCFYGEALFYTDKYKEAAASLETFITANYNGDALTKGRHECIIQSGALYAQACVNAGEKSRVVTMFDLGIRHYPNDLELYYFRAVAHHEIGNDSLAIRDFTKIIETSKDPQKQLQAIKGRVESLSSLEQYSAAIEDTNFIMKSEAADPEMKWDAQISRLGCFYKSEQYPVCIREATEILKTDPDNILVTAQRGVSYLIIWKMRSVFMT